jgi:thiamine kinase-like enzyme
MPDPTEVLNDEQLAELEKDLLSFLKTKKIDVQEIELIGLKGAGDFSTVFALTIDGVYHIMKVYRKDESFQREIRHLRRQLPRERSIYVWPASSNRFKYFIVIIEVPEGMQLHERMLSPIVAERLGDCLINLHSLKFRKKPVSITDILHLLKESRHDAIAHGALFPELGSHRIEDIVDSAISYVERHADMFRVKRVRTHNDLWWANVIVAEEDVYLIDWENLGRDDYCRDLAFFRLMVYYERTAAPVSMWDEEPDNLALETFWTSVLERYPEAFNDETFWQRYGLYAVQTGLLNFSRAYYGDRRGARAALNIVQTGIRLFEDYCLAAEAAAANK